MLLKANLLRNRSISILKNNHNLQIIAPIKFNFSSQDWIQKIIKQTEKSKTIAIVAHEEEIKAGELDNILPNNGKLSKSKEFLDDLSLNKSFWFYYGDNQKEEQLRRILLIQKKKDKIEDDGLKIKKQWREIGVTTCQALQSKKTDDAQILITSKSCTEGSSLGVFQNSFILSNYENSHKKQPNENDKSQEENTDTEKSDLRTKRVTKKVLNFNFVPENEQLLQNENLKFQQISAGCTELARNLANTRGTIGNPAWMENQIHELLKKNNKGVKEVRVLDSDKLQQLGMNLFYNVGKGAVVQPRCVIVHYEGNPEQPDHIDLALVGKGITFDTGGLNLKPTGSMEDMYGDKGGSCAVIGALKGTIELQIKKNIIFACSFAENSIGNRSYLPGDIIKSMNGLTVEIGNTDAEGRLVLADTFTYVQKEFNPKQLIDLATLTGACVVALGNDTAGLFTNDENIKNEIVSASSDSFEPVWHLPIQDEHKETIKGAYGDICNTGKTRWGGASSAAAFLLRFVDKNTKWAHLDIAGPAMAKTAKPPVCADQTGFGVSLLLNLIKNKK